MYLKTVTNYQFLNLPDRCKLTGTSMSFLKGQTLSLKNKEQTVILNWKQGSFIGFGDERSQNYILCNYTTSGGESVDVPVFIQADYDTPQSLTVNSSLQCGMQENVLFFVLHDKSQTPYQQRFRTSGLRKFGYIANEVVKMAIAKGVDLSTVADDYLQDV